MREIQRARYRTARLAAQFFVAAKAQGFSPSLVVSGAQIEVVIFG